MSLGDRANRYVPLLKYSITSSVMSDTLDFRDSPGVRVEQQRAQEYDLETEGIVTELQELEEIFPECRDIPFLETQAGPDAVDL